MGHWNVGKDNPMYGKKLSVAHKKAIGDGNRGENNGMWKGDKVGFAALHEWVWKNVPKPDKCQCCNSKPPYDAANISQKYRREISDWEWLCRSCHMHKDGRISNLKKGRHIRARDNITGRFIKKEVDNV